MNFLAVSQRWIAVIAAQRLIQMLCTCENIYYWIIFPLTNDQVLDFCFSVSKIRCLSYKTMHVFIQALPQDCI